MSSRNITELDTPVERASSTTNTPKSSRSRRRKQKNNGIPEGEGNYPHIESRSGEQYNAVVPKWEFGPNQNTNPKYRQLFKVKSESADKPATFRETLMFLPDRMDDDQIDQLVNVGHQLIHENDYDFEKTKQAILDYPLPVYHPFLYPYFDPPILTKENIEIEEQCPCSCHIYSPRIYDAHPLTREVHSNRWGLMMMKRLDIDTSFLKEYFNRTLIDNDVCGICCEPGYLIICDGPCKQSYHLHCLHLKQNPSEDTYICPICRYNKYKSTNITCYDIQHDFVHQYECENDLNEDIDISAIESTLGHTEKNKRVDDSDDRSDDKRRKTSKSPQGRFSDKKEGKMNRKKRRFAREDSDESSSTSITRSNDEQSEDKEDNENPSEPVVTRSGRKVIPRLLTDPFNLYYTNKDTRVSHRHKEDDSEESDDEMSDDQEEQDSASKVNVKEEQQSSQSGSVTSEEETVSSSDDGTTESEESEASSPSESDSEQKYEFGGRKKQEEEDDDDNFTLHHRKPKTKKLSKFDKSKVKKIVDILTNRKFGDRSKFDCGIGNCTETCTSRNIFIRHLRVSHKRCYPFFKDYYFNTAFQKAGLNEEKVISCPYPGCRYTTPHSLEYLKHVDVDHKLDIYHYDVIGNAVDILYKKKHYTRPIAVPKEDDDEEEPLEPEKKVYSRRIKKRHRRRRFGSDDDRSSLDSDYKSSRSTTSNRKWTRHSQEEEKSESGPSSGPSTRPRRVSTSPLAVLTSVAAQQQLPSSANDYISFTEPTMSRRKVPLSSSSPKNSLSTTELINQLHQPSPQKTVWY